MTAQKSESEPPLITVFGGTNGTGKSTFASELLPHTPHEEFLNADVIAADLNPSDPSKSAVAAARILLTRWRELVAQRRSFAFESTLGGRTFARLLSDARDEGYRIFLHFLWVDSVDICLRRVRNRVEKGGHDIPEADVRRRYQVTVQNFLDLYLPLADKAFLWDVSRKPPSAIAHWEKGTATIFQPVTYDFVIRQSHA